MLRSNAWLSTSLLIITQQTTSSGAMPTASAVFAGATTTIVNGEPSVTITSAVGFPTNLPTKIVPSATAQSDPAEGMTQISILFGNELPWLWMTENSNASAQIFAYTPLALAAALDTSPDLIQTVSLSAYQPSNYDGNPSTILTVYLANIPTVDVSALQAQLKSPNSALYQQTGVQGQIAQLMNPAFSILAYSTSGTTTGTSASINSADSLTGGNTVSTNNSGPDRSTTIIIAVVVSFGVVILAIAGYAAFWATKRGSVSLPASRNNERGPHGGQRREPSGLRSFQLGAGNTALERSGSTSTTNSASTDSTGYSGSSGRGRDGNGEEERRSSWWRFSAGSHHQRMSSELPSHSPPLTPDFYQQQHQQQPEMREHRRINVVRGANGQFENGAIGQPQIQSNSLML
jgi:hypothetical protein